MRKDIDGITGLYCSVPGDPYTSHPFPFNIKMLGDYLKSTKKTMGDLTVKEFEKFRISPIAKAE